MEEWKNIQNFDGYQVSNKGRVRSFWKKKRKKKGYGTERILSKTPTIMKTSDDGNGYQKLMLYSNDTKRRHCKKVHRLVAEAFIPHEPWNDTVDHITSGPEGKLDNRVNNLRWISRRENIQKAYRDGICDGRIEKQNKPIIAHDLWTGEELFFWSIKDAANDLNIDRSSISHVLIGDLEKTSHYYFEYADGEETLLHQWEGEWY